MNAASFRFASLALACGLSLVGAARAEDKPVVMKLDKYSLTSPEKWTAKEPKFKGIVSYEFAAPKAEGDADDGRCTVGPLSGGLEANLSRWFASFQPEGEKEIKPVKKEIGDVTVYLVDVTGTYTAPPFAGGGEHKNYRLLGAMLVAKDSAHYVKFQGPKKTIGGHEKAFKQMIESLKAN